MPLLGLFSRKNKQNSQKHTSSSGSKDSTGTVTSQDDSESVDTDYVLSPSGSDVPSMRNGAFPYNHPNDSQMSSSSTSKLRHPFRRKHSSAATSPLKFPSESKSPRHTKDSPMEKAGGSANVAYLPPPRRSSLFAALDGSQRSQSSQSLPEANWHRPLLPPHQNTMPAKDSPSSEKSGSTLFSWAHRDRSKPKLSAPPSQSHSFNSPQDSFNLKSFRHIRPDSPSDTPDRERAQSPPTSFSTPPARTRGNSTNSDSSQRISVAAFREAQARRSSTNLSIPSPSPSLHPALSPDTSRAATPSRPPRAAHPESSPARAQTGQPTSSSSESSSEEEASDSDGCSPSRTRPHLDRQRTITKHSSRPSAKSELGHGSSPRVDSSHHRQSTSTRSDIGHGTPRHSFHTSASALATPPSSFPKVASVPVGKVTSSAVGTRSFSIHGRSRASHSTSDLTPSAAAKRASLIVAANAQLSDMATKTRKGKSRSSDTSGSDSEPQSSDEDDSPLAMLLSPKRPGTAMSNGSAATARTRTLSKPLIDLNVKANPLTGKPAVEPAVKNGGEDKDRLRSPTNINNRLMQLAAGLNSNDRSARSNSEDDLSSKVSSPTETTHSIRLVSPPPIPPKSSERGAMSHPRMKSPEPSSTKTSEQELPFCESPTLSTEKHGPTDTGSPEPPIPVRERTDPDTGFKVVSRPARSRAGPQQPRATPTVPQPTSPDRPTVSTRINPTPIRHRPNASSFSVTSRPQSSLSLHSDIPEQTPKERAMSVSSSADSTSPITTRPPSATLASLITPTSSHPPPRPFADKRGRDSPASSTGGSSGKAPLTPGDGSDYFSPGVRGSSYSPSASVSGISSTQSAMKGGRGHLKRNSVSFGDTVGHDQEPTRERGRAGNSTSPGKETPVTPEEQENRRRERRRSEAKAAIELGNVINGRGPIDVDDDDDEDLPIGSGMGPRMRMSNPMVNPTMGMGAMNYSGSMPAGWNNWQSSPSQTPILNPQQYFLPQPPMGADPNYLAAHQQAMMIAKQAYQFAVAQQAMAAAADEWERGSSVSGFGGGGVPLGMGMGMQGAWNHGGGMFPSAPRSMYAGSTYGGQSELGDGWGSASVFGESFGPSPSGANRRSQMMISQRSESSGNIASSPPVRPSPRPRTRTAPSNAPLPTQHSGYGVRKNIPPSSWKVGQ